jgi:hypothetical protein
LKLLCGIWKREESEHATAPKDQEKCVIRIRIFGCDRLFKARLKDQRFYYAVDASCSCRHTDRALALTASLLFSFGPN